MSRKCAFITGITGQDGSYLSELLLSKGYEVHGLIRRASTFNTKRIDHLYQDPHEKQVRFFLHYGDLTDSSNLNRLLEKIAPTEIYNLGAQSHVKVSFEVPEYTADTDGIGVLRLLDAHAIPACLPASIRLPRPRCSAKYRKSPAETDPFYPRSPYAAAKLRLLDHRNYHEILCPACLQWHPLQSRIPPPRRNLRHP